MDSFHQLGNEEEIRRAQIYFGACKWAFNKLGFGISDLAHDFHQPDRLVR